MLRSYSQSALAPVSFAREHGITMSHERVAENPNMIRDGKPWDADHWKVVLRFQRRQLTTYFSKGYGHDGKEPSVDEVLDCLASDASGYEVEDSFESWALSYGYDPDSRKAERTYNLIGKASHCLKRLLGPGLYDTLLYHTERM